MSSIEKCSSFDHSQKIAENTPLLVWSSLNSFKYSLRDNSGRGKSELILF